MNFDWATIINLGVISVSLLVATFIRARVRFFQRFLIPNALTAGFLLLFFYNFAAPHLGMSMRGLENFVYHFLNISFVAMSLRRIERKAEPKNVLSTVTTILSQYALQSLVGLGLTFLLIATFAKDLFPTFGLFITLGYCLGPGQAFSIGSDWEAFGFAGAGSVGLTFAAFGFLWAFFGGVVLVNHAVRKGWIAAEQTKALESRDVRTGIHVEPPPRPIGAKESTEGQAIDSLAYNLAVVLAIYLVAFIFLKGLTWLLYRIGPLGAELADSFWGIMFIFCALAGLLAKKVVRVIRVDHTIDNGTLTRISGTSVDIMVAASVGAIALSVVAQYWLPILIMGIVGGVITLVSLLWISSRIFPDHQFHRFILIYGAVTGTLPSGLALLRIIDQEFTSPASRDYVYAGGVTFPLAIPMLMMVNLPAKGFFYNDPSRYWITLIGFLVYLVVVLVFYRILAGKQAFAAGRLWKR